MKQVIRTKIDVEVDETDLVGIDEAAKMSGRKLTTIVTLVNSGYLPWFELDFDKSAKRPKKYTSRKAVAALGSDDIGITA